MKRLLFAMTLCGLGPAAGAQTCADRPAFSVDGPSWNGWSPDVANTRFQPADRAGLTAAEVPRLTLKWAFAFPDAVAAGSQPTVVSGRVFVGGTNGNVYSLDARTGCRYWTFTAEAPVRTAVSVAAVTTDRPRLLAFFGDRRANVYAVDATTGEALWKTRADDHPRARIVGAPTYHEGRLFVPVAVAEEGRGADPASECCSGRGALLALEAATGKVLWKTYTIDEVALVRGTSAAGTRAWGPSGASITSAPTLEPARKILYVGTGDNLSLPPTPRSDAVAALDMETGRFFWLLQVRPPFPGPGFDFWSSPLVVQRKDGRRILLAGQRSGMVYAFDPAKDGKILWQTRVAAGAIMGAMPFGPATDGKNVYVAVADPGGGLVALDVWSGKKVWAAPPPPCPPDGPKCSLAQSAAVTAIPGAVFSGSMDGHLRAYAARDGQVIWDFDTARDFTAVNGVKGRGGSLDGPGPTVAGGMLFVESGSGNGLPGNVLLAFSVDGQ